MQKGLPCDLVDAELPLEMSVFSVEIVSFSKDGDSINSEGGSIGGAIV